MQKLELLYDFKEQCIICGKEYPIKRFEKPNKDRETRP